MKISLDLLPNPFEAPLWWGMESPITREEVQQALALKNFCANPIEQKLTNPASREQHIQRVAYLVQHGWTDPICIELWRIELWEDNWPVQDGNHRLAAAYFMGNSDIEASLSGFLDLIQMIYGNTIAKQAEQEWRENDQMSLTVVMKSTCPTCNHTDEVEITSGITYNLSPMFREAGWDHHDYDDYTGEQMLPIVEAVLERLIADPERYKKLNPPNKWGCYEDALWFFDKLVEECRAHPTHIFYFGR